MSAASNERSAEFLKLSGQFKLGALVTESSHPVTAQLSEVAKRDIAQALDLLFQVDTDVVAKYREFAESGRAGEIAETVVRALHNGGRLFFTGCGSTGRLSIELVSIWRDFWQRMRASGAVSSSGAADWENRASSVMAGGDFALIKSVEGFEDFAEFGKKQIGDLGVSRNDVVFAITEGGETPFVIGTAWRALEAGAKVYFIYNNPDDVLGSQIQRSREVIHDPRIEKINLTTGPMAIAGSTRMQATSIQLCVLLTVMEMVVGDLILDCSETTLPSSGDTSIDGKAPNDLLVNRGVPAEFSRKLAEMHVTLRSKVVLSQLAQFVALEESVYHSGHKVNYYADGFGIDVLTDTAERSPTYCTPSFRKFDDPVAAESWSFLFLPDAETSSAWKRILKREPRCVEWTEGEVREMVSEGQVGRAYDNLRDIGREQLMRFKIGLDGLPHRPLSEGDAAVAILCEAEKESLLSSNGFYRVQLEAARQAGARSGIIFFGNTGFNLELKACSPRLADAAIVPVPNTDFLLDGVTRVGVKMLLNALSTCTMVRLGRVTGNSMIWVVPSNLKLVDRATRYIQKLASLNYEAANRLLFEVIEYVEPRMKADQAYPPVVGLAVMRSRHGLTNELAEKRLLAELVG
jgi:N-acetylmuramic acid 6-phosphate etherase